MIVIPAIDLLGGACVRLQQGSYDSARRYAGDPAEVALGFARAGARWVHVVDLDAARGAGARYPGGDQPRRDPPHPRGAGPRRGPGRRLGEPAGLAGLPSGGGRRHPLSGRLGRAGGGGRRPPDPGHRAGARPRPGGRLGRSAQGVRPGGGAAGGPAVAGAGPELWAGIDARDGRVRVSGWGEEGGLEDLELARRARELGLGGIVYTSIARDGTLGGPDIERTNRVAEACGLPVILSGGIGSAADVERVHRERAEGVVGVIVGKALYEGRVELAELIRRYG